MPRKSSAKGKGKKAKSTMANKGQKRTVPDGSSIKYERLSDWAEKISLVMMLVIVSLLLFIGPFERGIFFQRELLFAQSIIFGMLIIWGVFRYLKRDNSFLGTPLDICMLVLVIAYAASFFVAVHKRDALEEVMKIAAYLVVYLVTADICRHWFLARKKVDSDHEDNPSEAVVPPGLYLILHLLLASATVITIASLGAAAGQWDFVGAYAGNRIASPMGYANTAAAYLMASYFLSLGLAPLAKRWLKVFYLAPAVLMLITVVLTFSRGAWLLLPPLALLLVLASAPPERLRSFLYLVVTTLVAVPVAFIVDPLFRSGASVPAWGYLVLAALLSVLLGLLVELYLNQSRRLRAILAGAGLVIAAVVIIVIFIVPLMAPLNLERSAEETADFQMIKQLVDNAKADTAYQLQLEVNAEQIPLTGLDQPEYAWGIRVLGDLPGYENEVLIDYRGSATNNWEEKILTFETGPDTNRLDIQLYNRYPGTSVTVRSVVLSSDREEQKLRFTLNRLMPPRFYERIFSFSRDRNMDRRFELFQDAIKVIKDYPLLGTGGGGWKAVYHSYQDQAYISNEVHNHYLQVWVEAGLFGFLSFIGIWISFIAAFIRNCLKNRASPQLWQFWAAIFLPVAALGAHSAIDWNFSMAAVGIFLVTLLGAGRSLDRYDWFERFKKKKSATPGSFGLLGIAALVIGVLLLLYSVVLIKGLYTTGYSQELIERNNLKQATIEMQNAIRLDTFRADNYHNLNILLEEQFMRSQFPGNPDSIVDLAKRAYELESFNPRYVSRYGDLLFRYVNIEQGLSYIDRVMELRPLSETSYYDPCWARLHLAEFYLERGDRSSASRYLDQIFIIEETMNERYGDSSPISFFVGQAYFMLDDYQNAVRYFKSVDSGGRMFEEAQRYLDFIEGEVETP